MEKLEPSSRLLVGTSDGVASEESRPGRFLKRLNTGPPVTQQVPLLCIHPEELKKGPQMLVHRCVQRSSQQVETTRVQQLTSG